MKKNRYDLYYGVEMVLTGLKPKVECFGPGFDSQLLHQLNARDIK